MDETMQSLIELETEAEHLLLARHQVIVFLFFEKNLGKLESLSSEILFSFCKQV